MTRTNLTAVEALRMISLTEFRDFDDNDWQAFLGCESEKPRIGFYKNYTIVIDGDTVNIIAEGDEYGGQLFSFSEMD